MAYGCKCATPTDEYHGWECDVTGGACVFLFPNSKLCAEKYGEGPDANESEVVKVNHRELVYKFFDLSFIKQIEILQELNLLDDDDNGKKYTDIIAKIINKAEERNQITELMDKVNKSLEGRK